MENSATIRKLVSAVLTVVLLLVFGPVSAGEDFDGLTKSDKERIAVLEKAAKKYKSVRGSCGITFLDERGLVIREYVMPNLSKKFAYPGLWTLEQLIDGWAIYHYWDGPVDISWFPHLAPIAVRQSSMRGELRRGARLYPQVTCLGRLEDGMAEDVSGFPVRVRRYEAIYP